MLWKQLAQTYRSNGWVIGMVNVKQADELVNVSFLFLQIEELMLEGKKQKDESDSTKTA